MTTKTLRIPMLIDANGKWAALGATNLETPGAEPDWAWMDETADFDQPLVNPQRKWITVTVELPTTDEVAGTVEPALAERGM